MYMRGWYLKEENDYSDDETTSECENINFLIIVIVHERVLIYNNLNMSPPPPTPSLNANKS